MTCVEELNIENEIIPFFDYSHNKYAKQFLIDLFQNRPVNLEEISERQNILLWVKKNWTKIEQASYYKVDLEEVYQFSLNIIEREDVLEKNKLKRLIRRTITNEKQRQLMSKVIQMLLIFDKIYNQYFIKIDLSELAVSFKDRLRSLIEFFQSFSTHHYSKLITNDEFRFSHVNDVLKNLISNRSKEELEYTWNTLFLLEAYISVSTTIIKNNFCFPTFQKEGIEIDGFYHPLLKNPTKNSLMLNNHIVLLTGPNMSGKSTFLKSVGLCVYLGHLGFGVPASLCKIPFFDSIFISINLKDDIKNAYSHFMMEIINLKKVLMIAKEKKVFAVFDELFRGTNIDDALEITSKTITGLSKFINSYFFISTHLYQLKDLNNNNYQDVVYYYIDCKIENNVPVFSYQIKEGWSNLKIGRILFENEGLPKLLG